MSRWYSSTSYQWGGTVALLESPPITWKPRSFLNYEKKLNPKLQLYSAAALISVFGKHFVATTLVVNDQVETYVDRLLRYKREWRHKWYL